MIAVEKRQKTGLRSGGSFGAAGPQCREAVLDFGEIQHEIVQPQACALAHRGRLGRLKVRECKAGERAMFQRKCGQRVDHRGQSIAQQRQAVSHQQKIGIVGDVAARGAQVDDGPRLRASVTVRVNMGHHIVPELVLVALGCVEVDIVDVGTQLLDLFAGDRKPQLGLGFGQDDPQSSPC